MYNSKECLHYCYNNIYLYIIFLLFAHFICVPISFVYPFHLCTHFICAYFICAYFICVPISFVPISFVLRLYPYRDSNPESQG